MDWPYTGLIASQTIRGSTSLHPEEDTRPGYLLAEQQFAYTCQNPATAPALVAPGAGAAPLAPGQAGNCATVPGSRYQTWLSRSTQRRKDINGADLPGTRIDTSDVDKFGNVGRAKVDMLNGDGTLSGHSKVTDTWYSNDEANWILGRSIRSNVKAVQP